MIYLLLIFFVTLSIFLFFVNKLLTKKGYDISQVSIWILASILLTACIGTRYGLLLLLPIFFVREIRTPLIFCFNSLSIILGASNDFTALSRRLIQHNTIFKENFSDISKDPSIWLLNYPSKNIIEYYTLGLFPDNFIMLVNKKANKILSKAIPKERIIGIDFSKTSNYENIKNEINNIINNKHMNVLVYFDTKVDYKGFKSRLYSLQTPRSGILSIAKELSIKVTPIVVDHLLLANGIIPRQNFEIRVCEPLLIKNVETDILEIKNIFDKNLKNFLLRKF